MSNAIAEEWDSAGTERPSAPLAPASLALAMLLSSLGTSIANVALPALAEAYAATFQAVQWVVLAYLLAVTAAILGVGRLGDLIGRRRLLLAGLLLFTSASILCAVAPTLPLLIAARAAQGLGAAMMMALSMALAAEAARGGRTGSAMGLLGATSAAGTALGPSLGGVLIAGFGWPSVFWINAPLGAAAFLLALRALPADRPTPARGAPRFDMAGTLLLAATLLAYAVAATPGSAGFGRPNLAALLAAALGLALFVRVEARAASPLVPPAMLRDRALSSSLAAGALVSAVVMATLVVGPFYLSRALGLDAARVGLVLAAGPLLAAFAGVPAGRLADRFGAARMSVVGLVAMAAGCSMLALLPEALGVCGYLVPLLVLTGGYALFQTANNTLVMSGASLDRRGLLSGALSLSRNLGLITGAAAMGALFALASGAADVAGAPPASVAAGMRGTFAAAAGLIALALLVTASSRRA